jgi:hypothetical protein
MAKYRKKPIVVEAHRLPDPDDLGALNAFSAWIEEVGFTEWESERHGEIVIRTLEGPMSAAEGDWIIKGVEGEFYPCKDSVFQATYEAVA